jgi:hypothetical protein
LVSHIHIIAKKLCFFIPAVLRNYTGRVRGWYRNFADDWLPIHNRNKYRSLLRIANFPEHDFVISIHKQAIFILIETNHQDLFIYVQLLQDISSAGVDHLVVYHQQAAVGVENHRSIPTRRKTCQGQSLIDPPNIPALSG